MAGAKILCAYTMENADVGYLIEVEDVMVAKQLELFFGLYNLGNRLYVSANTDVVLGRLEVNEQIQSRNFKEIDIYDIGIQAIKSQQPQSKSKISNHKLAESYEAKASLIGLPYKLNYNLLPNDEVELVNISGPRDLREVTIPSFITSYHISESKAHEIMSAPFMFTKINSITINNSPGVPLNLKGTFSNMRTKHLKVKILHPECVYSLFSAFSDNEVLVDIDLKGFTGENLVTMCDAFSHCYWLENVKLPDFKPNNLIDSRYAYIRCSSLLNVESPKFNVSNVLFRKDMFYGAGRYE